MKVHKELGLIRVYWKYIHFSFAYPTVLADLANFGIDIRHCVFKNVWLRDEKKYTWNGYIAVSAFGLELDLTIDNNPNQ